MMTENVQHYTIEEWDKKLKEKI